MASYSKLILVGNVGRDPELHMTQGGKAVCNFSVAVSRYTKKGEPEQTDWFRIAVWGEQAERAQQFITKGRVVLIEGRLEPRTYVDKNNEKQVSLDVFCSTWQLIDKRPTADGNVNEAPQLGPDF